MADLWGGGVVMAEEELSPTRPVAPLDYTADLSAPLLGLFGHDDGHPSPAQVDQHEAELKRHGKAYEFHRYDGAGPASCSLRSRSWPSRSASRPGSGPRWPGYRRTRPTR